MILACFGVVWFCLPKLCVLNGNATLMRTWLLLCFCIRSCKVKPCLILSTLTSWMMRAPLIGKMLLRHPALMGMHCRYEWQHMTSWIVRIEVWFQIYAGFLSHRCMTCRPVPMFSLWPVPEYSFTETFSAFCRVPRQRTSARVPIVNCLVNSASGGFASLLIKPEVVSTHVNAQVWLFADEYDESAAELLCLSWTWLFFPITGGRGRGVFVASLAKHLQHQIHRGPQRSWSTSLMLYIR